MGGPVFFVVFPGVRDSLPLVRIFTRSFWAHGVLSHRLGGWGCANSSWETIAPTDQLKPVPSKCTIPIHSILTIIRFTQVPALELPMGSPQNSPRKPAPGENGSWIAACQNRHTHRSAAHCGNMLQMLQPSRLPSSHSLFSGAS